MATQIIRLDTSTALMEAGASFLGGAAQRVAWEGSPTIGMAVTGLAIVANLAGAAGVDLGPAAGVARGIGQSGVAIAGWLAAERIALGHKWAKGTPAQRARQLLNPGMLQTPTRINTGTRAGAFDF